MIRILNITKMSQTIALLHLKNLTLSAFHTDVTIKSPPTFCFNRKIGIDGKIPIAISINTKISNKLSNFFLQCSMQKVHKRLIFYLKFLYEFVLEVNYKVSFISGDLPI